MGYVPDDAKWFLADLVMGFRIEDDPKNLVHINTILVRADSAEEAHAKALTLGAEGAYAYENREGPQVTVLFRGLRDLLVVHDELEHGAELIYREEIGLSEEEVVAFVTPRGLLGVFQEFPPSVGPHYMPKPILDQLYDHLGADEMGRFMEQRGDRL